MSGQMECLQKRVNQLECLLGENYQMQQGDQESEAVNNFPLIDKLNKAESKLKDIFSNVYNGSTTFSQGSNADIHKSIQNIKEFLKKNEMKYATAIIGSKNKSDLLLKQEQDILAVIEYLELIEKNKKMITFDPILQVEERKQMVQSFEFMSEISEQEGSIKIAKSSDQTISEAYITQNEDIESLVKNQADIIDSINKKFLYFDAVLTSLEK